jgi:hypothetical protein
MHFAPERHAPIINFSTADSNSKRKYLGMSDVSISQHLTPTLVERLVEEREEQLLALATGICSALTPTRNTPPDQDLQTAWRLSQLLESELSSTKYRDSIRCLINPHPPSKP